MTDYVIMPGTDYKAACDAIRAKTNKTALIKSGDMAAEINSISGGGSTGGASFNIHYGTEAPVDTSKLWVETFETPQKTVVSVKPFSVEPSISSPVGSVPSSFWPSVAAVGRKLYILAGLGYSKVGIYDTTTNQYETTTHPIPESNRCAAVIKVSGFIYLFGGENNANIYRYTPDQSMVRVGNFYANTSRMGIASVGDNIYLFGGIASSTLSTIRVFSTVTNELTTLDTTLPSAMHSLSAATIGEKIYLFGGAGNSGASTAIRIFDTTTNELTTAKAVLPIASHSMAISVLNGQIYLFGGAGSGAQSNIYVYDPFNDTLTTLPLSLPTKLYAAGYATIGLNVFLVSGSDGSDVIENVTKFSLTAELENGVAYIPISLTDNLFQLTSGGNTVEIGVDAVYIGNADGMAEQVSAYLHNGTEWALI